MKTEAIKLAPAKWFLTIREMKEGDHHAEITLSKDSGFAEDSDEYMRVSGICSVANAKLIAASPELLDTLIYVTKMLGGLVHDQDHPANIAYHAALKAIKKATE